MKAVDFLKWERDEVLFGGPSSGEGNGVGSPSNGELRRWLNKGSVLVNGKRPKPGDDVEWPITQLVYFPAAPSQVTVVESA